MKTEREMKRERESVLILKITRRVRGPVERGLASIRISLAYRVPGVAFFFGFLSNFFLRIPRPYYRGIFF